MRNVQRVTCSTRGPDFRSRGGLTAAPLAFFIFAEQNLSKNFDFNGTQAWNLVAQPIDLHR